MSGKKRKQEVVRITVHGDNTGNIAGGNIRLAGGVAAPEQSLAAEQRTPEKITAYIRRLILERWEKPGMLICLALLFASGFFTLYAYYSGNDGQAVAAFCAMLVVCSFAMLFTRTRYRIDFRLQKLLQAARAEAELRMRMSHILRAVDGAGAGRKNSGD
jgi:hypothetical protein